MVQVALFQEVALQIWNSTKPGHHVIRWLDVRFELDKVALQYFSVIYFRKWNLLLGHKYDLPSSTGYFYVLKNRIFGQQYWKGETIFRPFGKLLRGQKVLRPTKLAPMYVCKVEKNLREISEKEILAWFYWVIPRRVLRYRWNNSWRNF